MTELFYVFWTPKTRVDQKCRPKGGDFFPVLFISKLDIYLSNFSAICERASFLPQIWGRENILQFRMPLGKKLDEKYFFVMEKFDFENLSMTFFWEQK